MSEASYWQQASNLVFSLTILVLIVGLLMLTIVAFFTSSLWAIGIALPFIVVIPHIYYRRARGKSWAMTFCCVYSPLKVIAMTVIVFYGKLWTPLIWLFLASVEFFFTFTLILTITGLLCERYLGSKFKE